MTYCKHGIHMLNACGACVPPRGTTVHQSQAHWPATRPGVINDAVRANGGRWPEQLGSGVMFYMGERITRAEFKRAAKESAA